MSRHLIWTLTILIGCLPAAETPYGHADFYPSAERPIGFLADGNGHYPAATLPKAVDTTKDVGVVWQVDTLPIGMAQPVVVGEKLIVTADPNLVVCLSVHDGKELWRLALPPSRDMPAPLASGFEAEWAHYEAAVPAHARWSQFARRLAHRMHKEKLHHKKYHLLARRKVRKDKNEKKFPDIPIDDPEFQTQLQQMREEQLACGWLLHGGANSDLVDSAVWGPQRNKTTWRSKVNNLYNLCTWNNWYGFLTRAYQTPVSDGEFVYVCGMDGQVACIDLYGRLRWLRWLPNDAFAAHILHTRFTKSPQLYGDTLAVRGAGYLRVLDKHSGAMRWHHVHVPGGRPNPEATPFRIMPLADASGTIIPILVDSSGILFRLSDGKKLHKFPTPYNTWESRFIIYGDVLITPEKGKVKAWRLAWQGEDLQVESLWKEDGKDGWSGIAYGDQLVMLNGKGKPMLVDPTTGKGARLGLKSIKQQYGFTHIVGDHLLMWQPRVGKGDGAAAVFPVKGGKRSNWRIPDDRSKTDQAFRDHYWYRGSNIFTGTNSAPTAQGNRCYWRSTGWVACFSDTKGKAPVSGSWPKQALQKTSAPAPSKPNSIIDALTHDHAAIRADALAKLADGASVSSSALITAYTKHRGAKRCDLLRAMALHPAGCEAVAPELVQDILTGDRGLAVNAGWALGRIGAPASNAAGPMKTWLMAEAKKRRRGKNNFPPHFRTVAVCLGLLGTGHEAAVKEAAKRKGNRRFMMETAVMIHAGTHAEAEDRPAQGSLTDVKP